MIEETLPTGHKILVTDDNGLRWMTREDYEDYIFKCFQFAVESSDKELLMRLLKIHGASNG